VDHLEPDHVVREVQDPLELHERCGVCLEVGELVVPKLFGLAFTAGGEVLRLCMLVWRRGALVGARYVTAKELREGLPPVESRDMFVD